MIITQWQTEKAKEFWPRIVETLGLLPEATMEEVNAALESRRDEVPTQVMVLVMESELQPIMSSVDYAGQPLLGAIAHIRELAQH